MFHKKNVAVMRPSYQVGYANTPAMPDNHAVTDAAVRALHFTDCQDRTNQLQEASILQNLETSHAQASMSTYYFPRTSKEFIAILEKSQCVQLQLSSITITLFAGNPLGDETLYLIAKNLPAFTNPDDQVRIAKSIDAGKFGDNPNVFVEIARNLRAFTNPKAQVQIAKSINSDKFGNDPNVFVEIARNLRVFTDPEAQVQIAKSIDTGKFGDNSVVLFEIAQNLQCFTDLGAQRQLAESIAARKFGEDPEILIEIINRLSVFSNLVCQRTIATGICNGIFDPILTDTDTLSTLIQKLVMFTDSYAQRQLIDAISAEKLGVTEEILIEIDTCLSPVFGDTELDDLKTTIVKLRWQTNQTRMDTFANNTNNESLLNQCPTRNSFLA